MEEDILFLEGLLNEDPSPPPPMITNQTKLFIKEPGHSFSMGYEHFSTTLVTEEVVESSTKNLVPISRESEINSDELNSHVESNFVKSTSDHDTVKFDNLDEFSGPFIPIHIAEEERIRREHADYINRMEMLFTINPRPHPLVNANMNVESLPSLPIPVQDNNSQREEIDIVTSTDDVLPPSVENDDSDGEVDAVDDLRVIISSQILNMSLPRMRILTLITLGRNTIVEIECIDARVKFDVFNDENDDYSYCMFAKVFSFLSAESGDTIFDPGIST
uniref:Reverse transcriptase domain-containing protein n=1 Tax=Tanacetum cinerariifolium TaxID=118510 RepID=A0A699KP89_TANCI|nr:hypothetical protein [Tanacetum cinerariifolium]